MSLMNYLYLFIFFIAFFKIIHLFRFKTHHKRLARECIDKILFNYSELLKANHKPTDKNFFIELIKKSFNELDLHIIDHIVVNSSLSSIVFLNLNELRDKKSDVNIYLQEFIHFYQPVINAININPIKYSDFPFPNLISVTYSLIEYLAVSKNLIRPRLFDEKVDSLNKKKKMEIALEILLKLQSSNSKNFNK